MIENRRTERLIDYLPITVTAIDNTTATTISNVFSGRIIDISAQGACLLMSQIIRNNFHIFYTTREYPSGLLRLSMNIPPGDIFFSIIARPIWMDIFQQGQIRAFKLGVDFTTNPQEKQMLRLQKAIKVQQKQRANWWSFHTAI